MIRNEYRRAFIMLRAALQGYGGHVRLERRTLTGSMYFIVGAPENAGTLRAALVGRQQDGRYYAASLGELTRDRRGQLTLAYAFDPRSIDGRPLEAYAWVAVADTDDRCAVALTGNVEGSRQVDPAALERAVCALFADAAEPAADLAAPGASATPSAIHIQEAPDDSQETLAQSEGDEAPLEDVRIYTGSRARIFTALPAKSAEATAETASPPAASQTSGESAPEADAPAKADPAPQDEAPASIPAAPTERAVEAAAQSDDAPTESAAPRAVSTPTAAQALGLDITRPWPASLEPMRRLFATQGPLASAPDSEYVYISAPMPSSSGYEACLIGLKAEDGRATGLRYALPARYAPLPPAGLEGYRWLGDGSEGFWILDVAVE